jgi:hypothetical protein
MTIERRDPIDFAALNAHCLARADTLLAMWTGAPVRRVGNELQLLNPTRDDRRYGSFSVNQRTGAWADFATGDKGGDLVSLYAFLKGLRQVEAARDLIHRWEMV